MEMGPPLPREREAHFNSRKEMQSIWATAPDALTLMTNQKPETIPLSVRLWYNFLVSRVLKDAVRNLIARRKYFWLTLVLGGLALSLNLWQGLGMDQSLYAYAAWVWKNFGQPPYIGVWDHDFPGIFIIHLIAMRLFGESILGFRFFDLLVQMAGLAMVYYLAARIARSGAAGFLAGMMFAIYYFGSGPADSGQREGFVLCLLLVSIVAGVGLESKVRLRAAIAGIALGLAFIIKPTYGLAWLVFGGLILFEGLRRPRKTAMAIALFGALCALPSVIVFWYYWRLGLLPEFFRAVLWYNFEIYRETPNIVFATMPFWVRSIAVTSQIFLQSPLIFISGLLGLLVFLAGRKPETGTKAFALVVSLAAVSLVSYLFFGKYFPYQLTPFWGLMSILGGCGWAAVGAMAEPVIGQARAKVFRAALYAGLVAIMLASVNPEQTIFAGQHALRNLNAAYLDENGYSSDPHQTRDQYRGAMRLKPMLRPGDRIEFFGSYPLLPFLLKQKLSSRFCSMPLLFITPPGRELSDQQRKWLEQYQAAAINSRPRFFVIHDFIPGHLGMNFDSPHLKQFIPQYLPALHQFLADNYRLAAKIGDLEIYEIAPR